MERLRTATASNNRCANFGPHAVIDIAYPAVASGSDCCDDDGSCNDLIGVPSR